MQPGSLCLLLGVGWNFMYVGGTTLLTGAYSPSEKAKTQGMHDFLVFGVTIISSFPSGLLLKSNGGQMPNNLISMKMKA